MTDLLSDLETPSDAELISRVRGGDVAAYGELFSRHVDAANRLGRQLAKGPDVDDLVSEAFAKVLQVLQGGGGPDVAFRAYLLTAVRRLHVDRIRASSKLQTSDDMTQFDPGVPFRDTAVESFESGAAAKAFASLPERWQLVLWHLEVEGQKPADIAPLLGMSANSVSALAYRAREGLRQAFLTMHLADISAENCRWVNEHLGGYVRKGLSRRDSAKVEEHLHGCRRCTAMYLELTEVNNNLAGIIGPLLLGGLATGYLASTGAAGAIGVVAFLGNAKEWVVTNSQAAMAGAVAAGVAAVAVTGFLLSQSEDPDVVTGADDEITSTTTPGPTSGTEPSVSAPPAPEPSTPASTPSQSAADELPGIGATSAPPAPLVPAAVVPPLAPTSGTAADGGTGTTAEPTPGEGTSPNDAPTDSPTTTEPGPTDVPTDEPTDPPTEEPGPTITNATVTGGRTLTIDVDDPGDTTVTFSIDSGATIFAAAGQPIECDVAATTATCTPMVASIGGAGMAKPAGQDEAYSPEFALAFTAPIRSDMLDVTVSVDGATTDQFQTDPFEIPDACQESVDDCQGEFSIGPHLDQQDDDPFDKQFVLSSQVEVPEGINAVDIKLEGNAIFTDEPQGCAVVDQTMVRCPTPDTTSNPNLVVQLPSHASQAGVGLTIVAPDGFHGQKAADDSTGTIKLEPYTDFEMGELRSEDHADGGFPVTSRIGGIPFDELQELYFKISDNASFDNAIGEGSVECDVTVDGRVRCINLKEEFDLKFAVDLDGDSERRVTIAIQPPVDYFDPDLSDNSRDITLAHKVDAKLSVDDRIMGKSGKAHFNVSIQDAPEGLARLTVLLTGDPRSASLPDDCERSGDLITCAFEVIDLPVQTFEFELDELDSKATAAFMLSIPGHVDTDLTNNSAGPYEWERATTSTSAQGGLFP